MLANYVSTAVACSEHGLWTNSAIFILFSGISNYTSLCALLQEFPTSMADLNGKLIEMAWDGFLGLSQRSWNVFFVLLVIFGMVGQNVTR